MSTEPGHIKKLLLVIYVACFCILMQGCFKKKPVKIGFIGGLTGRVADLGTSGRDGVLLAVEEQNGKGGINGSPIELIIKNDRHDAETAKKVAMKLIDEGVTAVIGNMTSSMSVVTVPLINEHKVLMISPTTSTNSLTGQDRTITSSVSILTANRHQDCWQTTSTQK